jgi:phosphoribosylformylglycinamidine cyclo-ligase
MYRVFNMGIGLILVVPRDSVAGVLERAALLGDQGWPIGEIVEAKDKEPEVDYAD